MDRLVGVGLRFDRVTQSPVNDPFVGLCRFGEMEMPHGIIDIEPYGAVYHAAATLETTIHTTKDGTYLATFRRPAKRTS